MSAFDFRTFRIYQSGIKRHQIAWSWWVAIMDNNPTCGELMRAIAINNPEAEMPWEIPF